MSTAKSGLKGCCPNSFSLCLVFINVGAFVGAHLCAKHFADSFVPKGDSCSFEDNHKRLTAQRNLIINRLIYKMTRFPDIKIIVFDLDDTLYPETQFVQSGFQSVDAYLTKNSISSKNLFPEMWKKFCDGERRTIFNNVLSDSGINPEEILVNKIVDVYRNHEPSISLYPDARPILKHFINSKKTGLLTDGFLQMQKNKVKALEIENYFDIIIFTDEIGGKEFWKPDPAGYKKIMDHFGSRGKNCLYVGDNPQKDFYGARILGWKTVQIKRPDGIYKDEKNVRSDYMADILITDLNQLTSIIELS